MTSDGRLFQGESGFQALRDACRQDAGRRDALTELIKRAYASLGVECMLKAASLRPGSLEESKTQELEELKEEQWGELEAQREVLRSAADGASVDVPLPSVDATHWTRRNVLGQTLDDLNQHPEKRPSTNRGLFSAARLIDEAFEEQTHRTIVERARLLLIGEA